MVAKSVPHGVVAGVSSPTSDRELLDEVGIRISESCGGNIRASEAYKG